jgi:hypothetical protein
MLQEMWYILQWREEDIMSGILTIQKGARVASGMYFVLMTNEDGSDKATAKIGVVN